MGSCAWLTGRHQHPYSPHHSHGDSSTRQPQQHRQQHSRPHGRAAGMGHAAASAGPAAASIDQCSRWRCCTARNNNACQHNVGRCERARFRRRYTRQHRSCKGQGGSVTAAHVGRCDCCPQHQAWHGCQQGRWQRGKWTCGRACCAERSCTAGCVCSDAANGRRSRLCGCW